MDIMYRIKNNYFAKDRRNRSNWGLFQSKACVSFIQFRMYHRIFLKFCLVNSQKKIALCFFTIFLRKISSQISSWLKI